MKRVLCLLFLLVLVTAINAQQKPRFSTQNSVGLLFGGSDNAPQVQTVNGIACRNWFAGIGTGIDWYTQRSIPLFLSGNRFFNLGQKRQFFLASGAGANFAWGETGAYISNGWNTYGRTFKPGIYLNAGLGYKMSVGKQNDNLLIQLGFNNKSHKEIVTSTYPCFNPPCSESKETFNYKFNVLFLKFGWGF
jgi:hypothetical protein